MVMQKAIAGTAGIVIGVVLLGGVASASHTEPGQAKKASFSLVNSFLPCGSPNTSTQSGNIPACTPTAPEGFGGCALRPTDVGVRERPSSGVMSPEPENGPSFRYLPSPMTPTTK